MRLYGVPGVIIVSAKALCAFEREHISGYIPHEVYVFYKSKNSGFLKYYYLEIVGKGRLDYSNMVIEIVGTCEGCHNTMLNNRKNIYPIVAVDEKTWDGSEIFGGMYCTRKFLSIIYKNELTCLYFKPGIYAADSTNMTKVNLAQLFN